MGDELLLKIIADDSTKYLTLVRCINIIVQNFWIIDSDQP